MDLDLKPAAYLPPHFHVDGLDDERFVERSFDSSHFGILCWIGIWILDFLNALWSLKGMLIHGTCFIFCTMILAASFYFGFGLLVFASKPSSCHCRSVP